PPEIEPLVVQTAREGGVSRLLQPVPRTQNTDAASIDAIDYGDAGPISVTGRGKLGTLAYLYRDNRFVGQSPVDTGGRWTIDMVAESTGEVHTLRLDTLVRGIGTQGVGKTGGHVIARAAIPFTRATAPTSPPPGGIAVVHSENVWRIA
ncbi:MAG: hypothetical protein HQL37_16660, partial [Alphaproteobacteria bacterium]|nr:hypothetical protein [Alphaproteobacteria bacterium]